MITNECFYDYALSYYRDRGIKIQEEFDADVQKFVHLKKLLNRDDANPRLILNHIIILYNLFHPEGCTNMLFFKIDSEKWAELKTYLVFLNFMPDYLTELEINSSDISMSSNVVESLRKI